MSYIIYYSDPAKTSYPITVADNTIYNGVGTGGLTLVGRNYPGYGQYVAEDFIHLLENFANTVPPINPIEGQLWYDSASRKLRINDGAANNANWKPVNGIYQQGTEPVDAVAGDIWVDTTKNQVFIHNGFDFSTLVGPEYSSTEEAGPTVETVYDSQGNPHQVVKIYVNGQEWAVIADDTFATAEISGFSNIQPGINLKSDAILNGIADSANYLRQNGTKVSGNSFVRNDISQTLNGQITITQDANALKIGTDPTFIIERTSNGSNANFVNIYKDYGSFTFNIKDENFANVRVASIGGEDRQLKIYSSTNSRNTATGALVVAGGAAIGANLYVGGKLVFTDPATSIETANLKLTGTTQATATGTGALQIAGGASIGGNALIGGNLYVTKKLLDKDGNPGLSYQVLLSSGEGVYWAALNPGNFTGGPIGSLEIQSADPSTTTATGALTVAGGVGIGGNINVGGSTTVKAFSGTTATLTSLTVTNYISITGTTNATSTTTGALRIAGGVGIGKDLYVGGTIYANTLTIQNTIITTTSTVVDDIFVITTNTNASSTNSGAFQVVGGAGIGRNLFVGGQVRVLDASASSSPSTGALTVAGGVGIQGTLYVGGSSAFVNGARVLTTTTFGGSNIDGTSLQSSTAGAISVNTATLMSSSTYARFVSTPATNQQLGGVKVGENIDYTADGTISLGAATSSKFGLVKIANNGGLNNSDGVINVVTATSTVLGGVRIGANIGVSSNGTISVADPYILPPATTSVLGGVKAGLGISVDSSGTISVNTASFVYVLPPATTSTLGGVTENPVEPSIVIDYPTGLLSLNYNFTATSGIAITHAWNTGSNIYDLTYGLEIASPTQLGGVKIGAGIGVAPDGTISVTTASFALQTATNFILGGVRIGANVNIDGDGIISVAAPYTLTTATASTLGGVKVGSNINVSGDGTISVAAPYTLTTATASTLGGVKVGSNINVSGDGTISVTFPPGYTLSTATDTVLGGVKIGTGISAAVDGTISVNTSTLVATAVQVLTTATASTLGAVRIGAGISSAGNGTISLNTATLVSQAVTATYAAYVTVPATTSTLGCVKAGTNVTVAEDGTISVDIPFTLNTATPFILGGVRIGSNVSVDGNGIISVTNLTSRVSSTYNATANTGTGVLYLNGSTNNRIDFAAVGFSAPNLTSRADGTKIVLRPGVDGTGVDVAFGTDNNTLWTSVYNNTYQYKWYAGATSIMTLAGTGTLVVSGPITSGGWVVSTSTYTLPIASASVLGGIKIGSGLNIAGDGTVSVPPSGYTLPAATTSTLGGVIVPTNSNLGLDIFGNLTFSTSTLITTSVLATQATRLQNARTINGVAFDGTANIVVSATTPSDLTIGTGLTGTSPTFNGSGGVTISLAEATTATLGGIYGLVGNNIALGFFSGFASQGAGAVAVGSQAGQSSQGIGAVAIGTDSGVTSQGAGAIAIGASAGNTSQGANSIAIGNLAGLNAQASGSIIINASGAQLNTSTVNSLIIKPIRANGSTDHFLFYNPLSSEVTTASSLANIVRVSNVTQATATATGALQVAGGASIGGALWLGGSARILGITTSSGVVANAVTITNVTQATATATGALQVAGGVSVGGNIWVGGLSILKSISTSTVNTLGTGTPTGATVYFTNLVPAKIGVYNGTAWADALGTVLF